MICPANCQWVLQLNIGLISISFGLLKKFLKGNIQVIIITMTKSYKLFILFFLFITQLIACVPVAVVSVPLSISDRRATEVQYIDQKIEFKAILETQDISEGSNISFVSYNQTVLIAGETASEEIKSKIELAVNGIVGENSSLKSKSLDVVATSNVKSRLFLNESKVSPLHIKVYSERQEVYLLGLLTQEEADAAISIVKSSKGIKKIVPLFEIDEKFKK
jgi:osmotically-inducible protein OsmY